jgi:hypothetical protein
MKLRYATHGLRGAFARRASIRRRNEWTAAYRDLALKRGLSALLKGFGRRQAY